MKKKSNMGLIRRFLPYYKKYRRTLAFDLFCAALTTLCEVVLPVIVRQITAAATSDVSSLTAELIIKCGILYLILKAIDTAAYYYMSSVGHIMGAKIETDMRRDMFAQMQRLSFSYYDNTKIGTLMSRITSDLFDVTEFAHHCPEEFFIATIKIIASFSILCTMSIPLTLIVFATVPAMIITLTVFRKRMKATFRDSRRQIGEINSSVEDSLLGIRVVKAFGNESVEEKKFRQGNEKFLKINHRLYHVMGGFHSCTRLFDGLMYIVVVVAGAIFLMKEKIQAADYVAYLMFVSMLIASIRRLVEFTEQFQRGMTGIERFGEVMDVIPSIQNSKTAHDIGKVKGNIEFSDVSFSYSDNTPCVISHLNLEIKAGENVALVGPSGGGKTTLCSLIPRFYEVSSGSVKIDGTDVRDVTLKSLRDNVGVVAQDVYLFSGSIRENIAYGKENATDEEIKNAAKLAGADEFITAMPNGYDTYVGERGVKLSGGQKQRISIARVFLKNPPILILDEATSALDNESERLVQKSLERLANGRTTLTIAHRLTTIINADRIMVLTDKGIEETGTHSELLAKGGIYSDFYRAYSEK
ncbi:MAG: ABC transporter ATP-binding protein [Eubacteriales bacterium]|nr:ABC transporter ATP-binding protein [Eubacteriales bacterium]